MLLMPEWRARGPVHWLRKNQRALMGQRENNESDGNYLGKEGN